MKRAFCLGVGSLMFVLFMSGAYAQSPQFEVKTQLGFNEGHIGKGRFSKYHAKEVRIAAHQIAGSYPFSLGFSLGREMLNPSSVAISRSTTETGQILRHSPNYAHNDELAAEIQAWMPDSMTGGRVRPFIKAGHTVWSNYRLKAKLLKAGSKELFTETGLEQGSSLAVGSEIRVRKGYSAVFELRHQAKSILVEDAGVLRKRKSEANGVLFGVTRLI